MGLDQAVTGPRLVAGIGFRHGVAPEAIVALIRRALDEAACGGALVAIVTAADRAGEPAIQEAAAAFGLVPASVEPEALLSVDPRVPTRSARIEQSRGVGSLAEATALAVAGEGGRLVLARIDDGRVTCALAAMAPTGAEHPNLESKRARAAQIATA
ncbi:cobalamin biosynthesis protein [Methylobacterium sp. WL12]|nr:MULTISPECIES: cobalamin biosynthesis protein [Methylobacterium]TXM76746.1 cobalamin biosynthesis protein [Methylobacterium sp. WL12]